MKITVVFARFALSGVPLAQIRLATALAACGHDVDLLVGYVPEGLNVPRVDGLSTHILGKPKVRSIFMDVARHLKKRKPDIVFTAEDHTNAIVLASALIVMSTAKISASSRVNPFDTYIGPFLGKKWFLRKIVGALMWRADALTCVSKGMVEQYKTIFKSSRHVCVYNIIDTPTAHLRMEEPVDHPWFDDQTIPIIVGAGQLETWKGFSDLIIAVHKISQNRAIRLSIFGEGTQRVELQGLIDGLGLRDSVRLEGQVANPLKYFAKADVFVLSSLLEGMPNVLIEAMMAGCTPVATDCPTGPREILESGRYGYLVPMKDPTSLAAGIEKAISNPTDPKILGEAIKPFHEDSVLAEHFRLLGI